GTLTVTIKGQNVVRTGTLAYTFSKHGEEWKIDAQEWGRTSQNLQAPLPPYGSSLGVVSSASRRSSERLPVAWILSSGRTFRNKSGNLAIPLAILRASSSVSP